MQFPNPIITSFIIYDSSGNAVIILGPGPFFKVINPVTHAELDIDAGTSFPEILFWNSAHTFFGKISLEVSTFSTRQMLLLTSPPDQSFSIPATPDVQPRLFMTSAIELGDVLPVGSDNGIGGQLYLDDASVNLYVADSANPSHQLVSLSAFRNTPAADKPNLQFTKGTTGGAFTNGPAYSWANNAFTMEETWNEITATVGFQNGWSNLGGNWTTGAFRLTPDGGVAFKGVIIGGTHADATTLFTLGAAYRPAKDVIMPIALISAGAAGPNVNLRIFSATGNVQCFGIAATANGNLSLDNAGFSLLV